MVPKGVSKFRQTVVDKLESEKAKRTPLSQEMFWKLVEEFAALEAQLAYYQEKLEASITASATLYPFSLACSASRWPEGRWL